MSNLPDDIILNILSWLPAKSLLRFRCVCKLWRDLVSDPNFVKMHLNRAIENNHLNLMLRYFYLYSIDLNESLVEAVEIDYSFKSPNYGVEIMGSCNGLLCITPCEDVICLWNPCTKEYKKLPNAPIDFPVPRGWEICSAIVYGFGYDHTIDEYKVVRIIYFVDEEDGAYDSVVEVYTLGTNSWRRIHSIPYYLGCESTPGILLNGSLHWIATRHPELNLSKLIVSFDIGDEDYREVPQPDCGDDEFRMNLGVLGGSLCILRNFYNYRVEVWVMKDYGVRESWAKLFTIKHPTIIMSYEYLKPLCFSKNGEIMIEKHNKDLVLYDPKSERARILQIHGILGWFEAVTYIGTLVSLNSGTYVGQEHAEGSKRLKNNYRKKRVEFPLVV